MSETTLSFKQSGWTSFWSYIPEAMAGMNGRFFSFKGGNLYKHDMNASRGTFYGVHYPSRIRFVFNDNVGENKLFKTISIEGNAPWSVLATTDIQATGVINSDWFVKKEGSFFAFMRNDGDVPMESEQYPLRSITGIGQSVLVSGTTTKQVDFSLSPLVDIGSVVSIGDQLYFMELPDTTVKYAGVITGISRDYPNDENYIQVDTGVAGAQSITTNNALYLVGKNSIAESNGVVGHYCIVEMENQSTSEVQLFLVSSEFMKSYP